MSFFLAASFLSVPAFADPAITATQRDSFPDPNGDLQADPGEVITYETIIQNGGNMAAQNLRLTSPTPGGTAFDPASVKSTPLARNDSFAATGNVGITMGGTGVLANDFDLGPQIPTVVSGSGPTAQGGSVTINPNGSFTYLPPAGFRGGDSFTYTIADESGAVLPAPATGSNTAVVTITVSDMIWFIDSSAGPGGDGTLASPFDSTADHNANALDADGDGIFLGSGSYSVGITLQPGQKLVGSGAGTPLAAALGITLASGSASLPATGGARPTITTGSGNGISLASGNTVRGLSIGNTAGDGIAGGSVGNLAISEVSISGSGGGADLSNGALNVTFDSISSNSSDNGIRLNGTTGSFTVTGSGSAAGSGGTLTGHQYGIRLSNVTNVTLRNMIIKDSQEDGIRGDAVDGFAFIGSSVTNFGTSGSTGIAPGDGTIESEPENGMDFRGLTGTVTIQNSTIGSNAGYVNSPNPGVPENHGIQIFNTNAALLNVTVTGSTFDRINNTPIFIQADNSDANVAVNGAGAVNTFSNYNGGGIDVQDRTDRADNSALTVDVQNNIFSNAAIGARWGVSGGTRVSGRFLNNTMSGTTNTAVRCLGNDGSNTFNSEVHSRIAGNDMGGDTNASGGFFEVARRGSVHYLLNGDPGASRGAPSNTNVGPIAIESSRGGVLHHTMQGNIVRGDAASPHFVFAALQVQIIKDAGSPAATLNNDIKENSFTLDNAAANFVDAIYFDDNGDAAHDHNFEGFSGTTLDQAGAHLTGQNTVVGSGSLADSPLGSGVQFFFGAGLIPGPFTDPDNDIDHPVFP